MKLLVVFSTLGAHATHVGQGEVADRAAFEAEAARPPEDQAPVALLNVTWASTPAWGANLEERTYWVWPHECKMPIEVPTRDQPALFAPIMGDAA